MIPKVVHGYRPAGLVRYLFGPGKYEEHKNPRVVASWDGAPWLHHPNKLQPVRLDGDVLPPGEFAFDLRPLSRTMQELAEAAGLPVANPPPIDADWAQRLQAGGRLPWDAPSWVKFYKFDQSKQAVVLRQGYVWHCSVRLHPDDPALSDEQWERIAERLMKSTGIHQAGCRWIAVRHADDHIHLMATLVSEHTGKRFYPYRDYPALIAESQKLERELGLVSTATPDKTAPRRPTRAEVGKAERNERLVTARTELRRVVGQCAASSRSSEEFVAELQREGLAPVLSFYPDGKVRGYTVALPGDLAANGQPVRYSGSKLAADLTWPKLQVRWTNAAGSEEMAKPGRALPGDRRRALEEAAAIVERASVSVADGTEDVDGVAHAAGEVVAVLVRGTEGRTWGPWAEVSDQVDRAARTPYRVLPDRTGPLARELRRASRQVSAVGALTGRGREKFAMVALILALAGLVAEIAARQQAAGRVHQAAAARRATEQLPRLVGGTSSGGDRASRPSGPPRRKRFDQVVHQGIAESRFRSHPR